MFICLEGSWFVVNSVGFLFVCLFVWVFFCSLVLQENNIWGANAILIHVLSPLPIRIKVCIHMDQPVKQAQHLMLILPFLEYFWHCRLSERGRTIIFSIHQPRFAIYRLFDTLLLLSKGEAVYHGPAEETLSYFDSIGEQL